MAIYRSGPLKMKQAKMRNCYSTNSGLTPALALCPIHKTVIQAQVQKQIGSRAQYISLCGNCSDHCIGEHDGYQLRVTKTLFTDCQVYTTPHDAFRTYKLVQQIYHSQ